ncbi:hypothetical protein ACWCQM_07015 [Streptomyces sp. NPDC002125]
MTTDAEALERVTAAGEEWPDGTYGRARPLRPPYVPGQPDPAGALHAQELAEALEDWHVGPRAELAARAEQLHTEKS